MTLPTTADRYCATVTNRRTLIYSAARFVRLTGDRPIRCITTETLAQFRAEAQRQNLSPATIESTVNDVILLYTFAHGHSIAPGKRLRKPRPTPQPASLSDLSSTYTRAPDWIRRWMAVNYWTCLRLTDCLTLIRQPFDGGTELRWRASKTGWSQCWPVPPWLRRHLVRQVIVPPGQPENHLQRVLRRELRAACRAAGCPVWTPAQLRDRAITEWSRVNAMAGSIVHGSGPGVLGHYVDPLAVLETAGPCVRLPAAFASRRERSPAASLPAIVARLDPDAQDIVIRTARRLAR